MLGLISTWKVFGGKNSLWEIKTFKPKKTLNLKFIKGFNGTMIIHRTQKVVKIVFNDWIMKTQWTSKQKVKPFLELTTQEQKLDGF